MNRLLVFALLAAGLVTFCGCGTNFRVSGAINPQFITGTVSSAQVLVVTDGGVLITVTLVTFEQQGIASSMNFCGNQTSQFVPGDFVEASFTPGQPCASVLQIIINGP